MLSQDKCLPTAYKCLGFTVLFVLEKYCGGFKMVFMWHQEGINTACPAHTPSQGSLDPLRGLSLGPPHTWIWAKGGMLPALGCFRAADAVRVRKRSSPVILP